MTGSTFDDFIVGDDQANLIRGGKGSDRMEGGLGNDIFDFRDLADIPKYDSAAPTFDELTDFDLAGDDRIDLSDNGLRFVDEFDGSSPQVRVQGSFVAIDEDGDTLIDRLILLDGADMSSIGEDDFIL